MNKKKRVKIKNLSFFNYKIKKKNQKLQKIQNKLEK
jgi:hypothetical protein